MEESWNYSAATCENELERNFLTDEYDSNEAQTFLAGSCQFQLDEIEVYQK